VKTLRNGLQLETGDEERRHQCSGAGIDQSKEYELTTTAETRATYDDEIPLFSRAQRLNSKDGQSSILLIPTRLPEQSNDLAIYIQLSMHGNSRRQKGIDIQNYRQTQACSYLPGSGRGA
jgi:hypothetical protein